MVDVGPHIKRLNRGVFNRSGCLLCRHLKPVAVYQTYFCLYFPVELITGLDVPFHLLGQLIATLRGLPVSKYPTLEAMMELEDHFKVELEDEWMEEVM